MAQSCSVDDFLNRSTVLLDTRSPEEYQQGHIEGATSFPLFSDDERAQVGTCYKHHGQAAAIELGLEFVAPKMVEFVRTAKHLAPDRAVRLHCWRGGMRSSSMAWLLETAGFEVTLLKDGYKSFRHWVRLQCACPRQILTLGGMTGSGKTQMLYALAEQGEQILDLEAVAHHRGSSYGALGLPEQPTTEQLENAIALQWATFDPTRPVWIEAESRRIGMCRVPDELFDQMMKAPVIQMVRSRQERIDILLDVYGSANPEELVAATERISRKLGGQHAKQAVDYIRQSCLTPAIDLILNYYDKTYLYDLQRRNTLIHTVDVTGLSPQLAAIRLIEQSQQILKARSRQESIVPS
ncbi:tRNA 2-selenouridine(34) synthase MnmH [Myxacorys almedinensis]|uniref:tRNA 2-selenouridine(34) synthase MnmH n=1 Tax=Myxacorys almedinensis A TaxID=2690445 RepID=A0A8J7Z3Z4_9CYAN|nr:tRNA 2-selenouridine(34) synthase MnmH [Myxacorys almedinensis]NDJ16048.1 tRNA 2-selenouridine(34) synthase MnmH [Myxacorys almedinensis A]